ncbi:MAG TPA: YhbY family RNA-binding protein [Gemmatimonadota bacterium]|nr:YhbY family RNA-binding protein [Gemmatimonadota bacterium]
MSELTSADRARLRSAAHGLEPVVLVGRDGLTPTVVRAVHEALTARELIKIRLAGDREQRARLAAEVAERGEASLVGTIGRIAILYREHADPAKRRYAVPSPPRGEADGR